MWKTYQGSFVSRDGHVVRCEIWREGSQPESVGELRFPSDTPLVVEWDAESKTDTIHGSTATLRIVSPADRTYLGLYTTEAGSVFLHVYRDNSLWWTGAMDTEFYEEPYAREREYEVSLTFQDFGLLHRKAFGLTGIVTVQTIVANALDYLDLGEREPIVTSATEVPSGSYTSGGFRYSSLGLEHLSVRCDNFTDEDGETMDAYDVLEAVLRPLGLMIRQWQGNVEVFDWHSIATRTASEEIHWTDEDQTLSTDAVANNVRVTFSPYASGELLSEDVMDLHLDGATTVYDDFFLENDGPASKTAEGTVDTSFRGFNIVSWRSGAVAPSGITPGGSPAYEPIRFVKYGNGETCDAIASYVAKHWVTTGTSRTREFGMQWPNRDVPPEFLLPPMFTSQGVRVQNGDGLVRISLPMLLSAAYNPFDSASCTTKGASDALKRAAGVVYVPVRIILRADNGSVYHYENVTHYTATGVSPSISRALGTWVSGAYMSGDNICAVLAYYGDDGASIDGGWATNRQYVGGVTDKMTTSFSRASEGQIIPSPPASGILSIEVYHGYWLHTRGDHKMGTAIWSSGTSAVHSSIRWHCYKAPSVELVEESEGKYVARANADIEVSGTLLSSAKDGMEVDTICGSTGRFSLPGARGSYLLSYSGGQIQAYARRAGRTGSLESLLVGTYYSQFATRHLVLAGTMRIPSSLTLSDAALSSSRPLFPLRCSADLITDEAECSCVEVSPDSYSPGV